MTFRTSIESAASYLHVTTKFVHELIASGQIEKVGDQSVTVASLCAYKERDDPEHRAAAGPA